MKTFTILISALTLLTAGASLAQPASRADASVMLWKDLWAGEPLDAVQKALAAYPEIKRIKLKKSRKDKAPALDVNMAEGGIPIFGIAFAVDPTFDLSGGLTEVTLTSGQECANQAVERTNQILATLEQKYGPELQHARPIEKIDVLSALSDSYQAQHAIPKTFFFADTKVAVILAIGFNNIPPPAPTYGTGLASSISRLARSIYDQAGQACDNSGHERVAYIVKYMPRSELDAQLENAKREISSEQKNAAGNL